MDAIADRRSIRKYKSKDIPKKLIEEIIKAGISAPSSKNRQPWKFIVVSGASKESMLEAMKNGLEREKKEPFLPNSKKYLSGAYNTLEIMKQAPVVIFIINSDGENFYNTLTAEQRISEICDAQSIGGAVENMLLAATKLGLGSLWICDIFFAYRELCHWLDTDGELYAAVTIGYADEKPFARPRKNINDVLEYRS